MESKVGICFLFSTSLSFFLNVDHQPQHLIYSYLHSLTNYQKMSSYLNHITHPGNGSYALFAIPVSNNTFLSSNPFPTSCPSLFGCLRGKALLDSYQEGSFYLFDTYWEIAFKRRKIWAAWKSEDSNQRRLVSNPRG